MTKQLHTLPLRRIAQDRGYETPNDLWRGIRKRLALNTVKTWWGGMVLDRIPVSTMQIFAEHLGCDLLDLIEERTLSDKLTG